MDEITLLRDLIRIPSPSGEERELGIFLAQLLSKDFTVKRQQVGNRTNVLAQCGKARLLLTTHMDTVPGQLPIREDERFIKGRGTCDAKASMAAMISAASRAREEGLTDFGLLFDVSEETDFSGIKKAIQLAQPETVIIGEPTCLKIINGQKGLISAKITCTGRKAHASMPEKGKSAIDELLSLLNQVRKIKFPKNKYGTTTLNIGRIIGGESANVVADKASCDLDIRTVTKNMMIIKKLQAIIPRTSLNISASYEPVLRKGTIAPYFTEMYFWNKKVKEVIVCGPGNIDYAHSDKERVEKRELLNGTRTYLDMIRRFQRASQ